MLEPSDRQVYWEPLSPPPGYELDLAVATTYSLDLTALLMATVPMAFGALDLAEDGLPDQISALASLQRVARRTTVFCQQAQIAAPGRYSRLFSLLEPVVAEVRAPRGGAFHPKLWLARYTAEEQADRYRLVVLSRNLTLDRSWDAMLVTDGQLRTSATNHNEPLIDLLAALPKMCAQPLERERRLAIQRLADELWYVDFERPEAVSRLRFHPIGIRAHRELPSGPADRRLVISPFLSDDTLTELFAEAEEGILISREDALDRLRQETLAELSHCRIFYWLDDVADEPVEDEAQEGAAGREPDAGETLRGLHAKIILSEEGDTSRLLMGSANATDAAFGNRNVEFCVSLTARRDDIGIDQIVPPKETEVGEATLRSLLWPYERRPDHVPPLDPPHERELQSVRKSLIDLDLGLVICKVGNDQWDLRIEPAAEAVELPSDAMVRCRPISSELDATLCDASGLWRGQAVTFAAVSLETLTTFVLFEISIEDEAKRLVMNLPIRGGAMPDQRQDRLIAAMIADSSGFLRYLLMLLWNDETVELDPAGAARWLWGRGRGRRDDGPPPLLEELVRTFSRHPERLTEINELIRRLRSTEEGRKIVPEEFLQLWEAFEAASGSDG